MLLLATFAFALPGDSNKEGESPGVRPAATPAASVKAGPALIPATDLIYRVPARVRASCIPVDTVGAPVEYLECSEGVTRAIYLRFSTVEAMDAYFDNGVGPLALPQRSGGCRAGIASQDHWRYTHSREREEGRMACFLIPPDIPATMVTQPEHRLVSVVISNPSLGWNGHFEAWMKLVPNPPIARESTTAEGSGPSP